jgi:hypothetical protein
MVSASQAMAPARCVLAEPGERTGFLAQMEEREVIAAPLVDPKGQYVGVVTMEGLQKFTGAAKDLDVESLVEPTFAPIHQSVHLDVVLETLTSTPQTWAAVIDDGRRVIGTIAISDIARNYRRTVQASLRRVSELGGPTGISEITVANDSLLVNTALRSTSLPRGVLITAIERERDIIRPTGVTVIKAGDRLMVLGGSDDLAALGRLAQSSR